jgi:phosphatidylserine/phosphatidylglycerophosphate/cardiolipin synthase-like enzyme
MPLHLYLHLYLLQTTLLLTTLLLLHTRMLDLLYGARSTLDICVFNITCNELAEAVIAAHRRGVRVRVITDNDQVRQCLCGV